MKISAREFWILMFSLACGTGYIYFVFFALPQRFLWLVLVLAGLMSAWNSVDLYLEAKRNSRSFMISVVAAMALVVSGLLLLVGIDPGEDFLILAGFVSVMIFVYTVNRSINRAYLLWKR